MKGSERRLSSSLQEKYWSLLPQPIPVRPLFAETWINLTTARYKPINILIRLKRRLPSVSVAENANGAQRGISLGISCHHKMK